MSEYLKRCELLIGSESLDKLKTMTVLIIGIGGVGSFAAEALARSGIGRLILVDKDEVSASNLNRQIHAEINTIDKSKTIAMKERILSYNPNCEVICIDEFYSKQLTTCFEYKVDYCFDAIDTITSKMELILECNKRNIPLLVSLGMANRLDPSLIKVTTLDKTQYDPVARILRQLVKKNGYRKKIKVVFSEEIPFKQNKIIDDNGTTRKEKMPPSSMIFVPASAGLLAASYIVRELIK